MVHRENVEGYDGTLARLAEEVGDLKYDSLAEFLRLLSAKIGRDGAKDGARGRARLAASLRSSAAHIASASADIETAWRISEPHMTRNPPEPPE